MAVFEHDVDLRGREVSEILTRELFECCYHCGTVALGDRLSVGTVFGKTAVSVHDDAGQRHDNTEADAHKYICKAIVDILEAKGDVKLGEADGDPRGSSHNEHIKEIEDLTLGDVLVESVTEFVRKYGADLVGRHRIHQIVVENDGLQLSKTCEISVELCGTARCVHNLDSLYAVAVLDQKVHKTVAQFTLFKRRKFVADTAEDRVEEGNNEAEDEHCAREDRDHPYAYERIEAPDCICEKEGEDEAEQKRADSVADKGFDACSVEAVFLFDDHVRYIAFNDSAEGTEYGFKQNDREDLHERCIGKERGECRIGIGEEKREYDDSGDDRGNDAQTRMFRAVLLPFGIGLGIIDVGEVFGSRIACRACLNDREEDRKGPADEGNEYKEKLSHC